MAGKNVRSVINKGLQTYAGVNAQAEQRIATSIAHQSMMGPYTMYGLAGAGAGLLFYLVAGRTGGPVSIPGVASEGQQTREQAHDARTEAGTHPVQICDFDMETHSGKKYTADDLQGFFSIIMFGDSVTDHALQGLHKMQEIIAEQDRQTNMQMNQPVWFVEDRKLMTNEEGKKKLQEVADANSKSQQRLTIIKKSVTDFAKSLDKPSDEKINADEGVFYLIGPDGGFRKAFGHNEDYQKIALAIAEEVKDYKKRNPSWHGPKSIKKRTG
ncbi:MAG: SCO1 mitochondrial [Trebouxia sp. A1-2]|nr:MAG: SCO1 mitochondrial [Trebouxia sp. A1-2]